MMGNKFLIRKDCLWRNRCEEGKQEKSSSTRAEPNWTKSIKWTQPEYVNIFGHMNSVHIYIYVWTREFVARVHMENRTWYSFNQIVSQLENIHTSTVSFLLFFIPFFVSLLFPSILAIEHCKRQNHDNQAIKNDKVKKGKKTQTENWKNSVESVCVVLC